MDTSLHNTHNVNEQHYQTGWPVSYWIGCKQLYRYIDRPIQTKGNRAGIHMVGRPGLM
jgi:hypothetical protein